MSEKKGYKYMVNFKIDVKRTDGQMLNSDENAMVLRMQRATEEAIAKVMTDYGQSNSKNLGRTFVTY